MSSSLHAAAGRTYRSHSSTSRVLPGQYKFTQRVAQVSNPSPGHDTVLPLTVQALIYQEVRSCMATMKMEGKFR